MFVYTILKTVRAESFKNLYLDVTQNKFHKYFENKKS